MKYSRRSSEGNCAAAAQMFHQTVYKLFRHSKTHKPMKVPNWLNGFLFLLNIGCVSFWFFAGSTPGFQNSTVQSFAKKLLPSQLIWSESSNDGENLAVKRICDSVLRAAKHLARAHRYARTSKTIIELSHAYEALISGLEDANSEIEAEHLYLNDVIRISPNDSLKAVSTKEIEVCPETWGGNTHGYPFYEEGFLINCTGYNVKAFKEVLTLVINVANEVHFGDLGIIAEDISKTRSSQNNYSDLHIVVGAKSEDKLRIEQIMDEFNLTTTVIAMEDAKLNTGAIIRKLIDSVKTKYVMLFKDVIRLNSFSRLERLVRLLSYVNADYVGGSHRNASGHWVAGCYQMAVKNYTMRVVEGYDLSYNSCMYCEYLSGPFAVRTELLKAEADASLNGEQFYADLWFKARDRLTLMSCPDSMFYTKSIGISHSAKGDWLNFVQKHELNKLMLPGQELQYTCSEAKTSCSVRKGMMIPLCCFQVLTDTFLFGAKAFDEAGVRYELEGGSNIGAVKLGGTLPWERDHDLNLRTQDFEKALKLQQKFKAAGYNLYEEKRDKSKCFNSSTSVNCGYMGLKSPNWRIELWGTNWLSHDKLIKDGIVNFTRINLAGYWIVSLSNPAAAARNQYNDDLMKHEEHWSTIGQSTGWYHYKAGQFKECSRPGFHGCFRGNYLPVGSLQFKDIWI